MAFESPVNHGESQQPGPPDVRQVMSPNRGPRLPGEVSGPDYGSLQAGQRASGTDLPNGVPPTTSTSANGGAEQASSARDGVERFSGDLGALAATTGPGATSARNHDVTVDGDFATPTGHGARETMAAGYPVRGLRGGTDAADNNTTTAAAAAVSEAPAPSTQVPLPLEPRPTLSRVDATVARPTDLPPPLSPTSVSRLQFTETAHVSSADGEPTMSVQTMVRQQVVQEATSSGADAAAQTSVWSKVGEFFQRRVAEPMRGQVQRASSTLDPSTSGRGRQEAQAVAASPKAPLIPPRVAQAMSEWANRPSLINPQPQGVSARDADSVSSGVPREVLMEEVKKAVAQAVNQRDEELRILKEQNEQLRRVLAGRGGRLLDGEQGYGGDRMIQSGPPQEAYPRLEGFEPSGNLGGVGASAVDHGNLFHGDLRRGMPDSGPPGLEMRDEAVVSGHYEGGEGSRGGIAAEAARPEAPQPLLRPSVEAHGGEGEQEPLHLLVQGMRQLQQAYMGRSEGGDFKGVDLPTIPDPGPDAAVEYADWLYEVEQSVGSISDKASLWFSGCMAVAHRTYMRYVESTPLQRLSLEPEIPAELKDPKWSRLERRVTTLLLGSLKKAAKEEMVTHRVATVPNLLYRLHVMYQPGGVSERASILRQLEGMSSSEGVAECISALRKWRRYLQRAEEMGVSVPDPSLLLRGVENISSRTLEAQPEVKFRVALAKNDLQLQSRPTVDNVIRFHNAILAELQQVGPGKVKTTGGANADGRLKTVGGPSGASASEAGPSTPTSPKKPRPCKFFLSDKGCTRGSQCKYEHSFPSREERRARCWECGAKNHGKRECPVLKQKDKAPRTGNGPRQNEEATSSRVATAMESTMLPSTLAAELQAAAAASSGAPGPTSTTSPLAATSGSSVQGETGSTSEVRALLQEANAMLSKMTKLNQMKVTVDEALIDLRATMASMEKEAQEREALLDSGASHVLKPKGNEDLEQCVSVKVELADGQFVNLFQNAGGSLMAGQDSPGTSTILPLGRLVQELGCELFWSRKKGLRIVHPEFGTLKTYTKGPFPMIIETQALALIAELEEKKVHQLRQHTVEGMKVMNAANMTPSFNWQLESYVQLRQKASALRALLHEDSVLGTLSETQRGLMAMDVDASDKVGWKYLRALPIRRSVRKAMMTKRWAVRVGGGPVPEYYKQVEDNDVIFLDFDTLVSRAFTLRGSSGAYKALMWAALRGQLDGVVSWPAVDDEVKNKLQWLWLVGNKATELAKTRRPFLLLGSHPQIAYKRTPEQMRFEEELGVPLSEIVNGTEQETYYVVTNMLLTGQRAAAVDQGTSKCIEGCPTQWSSSMHRNIVGAIKHWKEAPNTLEVARMLYKFEGPIKDMSEADLKRWKRHIRNGHLPYEKRCRTCVRSSATGRAHRRVVAPSCYVINIDVCGPFRQKGEYKEAKGYRYALVAGYVMPKIEGFKDYTIPEEETGEARDDDEHGPIMGGVFDPGEILEEEEEEEPETMLDAETQEELQRDNAEFEALYKEIGDTMEYQVLHFAVPLKSRRTPVVNDAIKTLYLQLRAEGLPVVRLHSDRARELQNRRLRSWLSHHDILATTGESQHPQSNGRAESVVKALKRRTKALLYSAPELPVTCWPYAMTYAAGQQRALAMGRKGPPARFGETVEVRKKFWYARRVDLDPKWAEGRYMGPSPDLRQGHLVRFEDGKFTTTSHFKAGVVIPEDLIAATERGRDPLPKPRRLRSKSSPPGPVDEQRRKEEDRDPTRGIAYDPVPKRRLRAKSSPPEPGLFMLEASARDGRRGTVKASARDGRHKHWEEFSAMERFQVVSALKLLRPLRECEQRAEDLAATFEEQKRYGMKEVELIFQELEQVGQVFSKAAGRQQDEKVTSWATGVYGHGGISSLRQGTQRLPRTTKFLATVARETLKIPWFGTIMLTKNVIMKCHRDSHNYPGVQNMVCAVTDFKGGGLWVQDDTLSDQHAVVKEVRPGMQVKGSIHELRRGEPFMFSPLQWHATEPHEGDRLVFVTYCPRMSNLSKEDLGVLKEMGFKIPTPVEEKHPTPTKEPTEPEAEDELGFFVEEDLGIQTEGRLDVGFKEELDVFVNGQTGDALEQTLVRLDEDHQQLLEDLQERSESLRFMLEEEMVILDETRAAREEIQSQVEKTQELIAGLLEDTRVKEKQAQVVACKACLRAATIEEEIDFETLLQGLGDGDLQVVHTVPMKQVRKNLSKWKGAVTKELNILLQGTLKPMDIQVAKKLERQGQLCLVPSKGVATLKPPTNRGEGYRRRFRLVLCGNHAEAEPGYGSLYAGGASVEAFRAALIMGSARRWRGASSDVSAAFLLAEWPQHLRRYAVIPPRFMVEAGLVDETTVWEVCRPLYGLRESPSIWASYRTRRFKEAVIPFGAGTIKLRPSLADPELWLATWSNGGPEDLIAILVLYVDDIFYVSEEEVIQALHSWVVEEWPCSPLEWAHVGPGTRYLGCEVVQRGYQFLLSQSGYIADLLRSYEADNLMTTLLPSPKDWIVDPEDDAPEAFSEEELRQGQKHVGELLWLCLRSRPDLQFVVSHMSQWVSKQPVRISKIGQRVLGYLARTQKMRLALGHNHEAAAAPAAAATEASKAEVQGISGLDTKLVALTGYSDASFAPSGGRSYGAVVITMGESPVAWRAARQPFVTLSVMEAELLEISEASVLMDSVGSLVDELAGRKVPRTLKCDNTSATALAGGGPGSWRTRHLRVRSAHLIERIQRGEMSLSHIEGQYQLADLGTKMHPKVRLWQLLRMWGFEELPPEAVVGLVVRVCFFAGVMAMIERIPGALAADEEKPPISRTGTDELLVLCGLVCVTAIVVWEALKWLVRTALGAPAIFRRQRKLERLRERAREAAEEEIDRAYNRRSREPTQQPASSSELPVSEAESELHPTRVPPPRTPRHTNERRDAMLVSPGGTNVRPTESWADGDADRVQRGRVAYDMLMLFRVEELKAGLREEGLLLTGRKEDLARRLSTRIDGPLDREPSTLPTVRQMKYVLWLWRNHKLAGKCLLGWEDVSRKDRLSQWLHRWKDR